MLGDDLNFSSCRNYKIWGVNTGKYVFAQLVNFLPQRALDGIAMKCSGNKYVKHFTYWKQLLTLIFGQLANRDSLRDLIVAHDAHNQKCYHLGFGQKIAVMML